MDLNIIVEQNAERDSKISQKIKKAIELGFTTIALNTIVGSENLEGKLIKVPEPVDVEIIYSKVNGKRIRILRRLTAIVKETIHCHHLIQSPVTKKYDIIAVQPVGEKMLQHVCASVDVDIISFDFSEKLGYSLKRTYLNQAAEKGIVFEILYAPCIRDRTARRNSIAGGQVLVDVAKKKSIIISSGTWNIMELRGVLDVINLGQIFGLTSNQSQDCVRKVGQNVLAHSDTRRKTGCGFVSMQEINDLTEHDKWVADICRMAKTSGKK